MSDDLVARIGDLLSADAKHGYVSKPDTPLLREAAARIRELEAERDEWRDEADLKRAALASTSKALDAMAAERDSQQRVCMTVMAERDALRALLSDIRLEGRITGNIAKRLIAALGSKT